MYAFLDESGDTGFKFDANSSRYFMTTLIIVGHAEDLNAVVEGFKADVGMRATDELKFRTARPPTRARFFRTVGAAEFSLYAYVVDKQRLSGAPTGGSQSFYQAHVCQALSRAAGELRSTKLVIDESVKSSRWQRDVATYLRQNLNSGSTRALSDIRFRPSIRDPLLQAADMMCGAIMSVIEDDDHQYIDLLGSRVREVYRVP